MAQSDEELQRAMDALTASAMNAAKALGDVDTVSDKSAKSPKVDIGKDLTKVKQDVKTFGDSLEGALMGSVKALTSFAGRVGSGDTSFSALSDLVDGAANAVGEFKTSVDKQGNVLDKQGKETGQKIGMFGSTVNATAKLTEVFGEGTKKMLAEMDMQMGAFHELSKSGAIAGDGITGMQRQWLQSGLKMDQFTKAVGQNSEALALMGGTASQGSETFSKMMGEMLQGSDNTVRKLGYSTDTIAEAAGGFIRIQTKLGMVRNKSAADMKRETQAYLVEMAKMSKLTGVSIDELEKQQEEATAEDNWQAFLSGLSDDQKKEAQKRSAYYSAMGMGKEARAAMIGNFSEMGAKFSNTYGTAIQNLNQPFEKVVLTNQDYYEKNIKSSQIALGKVVDASESPFLAVHNTLPITKQILEKGMADASAQIDNQLNKTDKQTDAMIDAEKDTQAMYMDYHKFLTKAMPTFATAAAGVTGKLDDYSSELVNLGETIEKITGIHVPSITEMAEHPIDSAKQMGKVAMGLGEKAVGAVKGNEASKAAMEFFMGKGWTKEQAAGIVGNLQQESGNFAQDVVSGQRKGDSGKAVGIAQWHADRQATFEKMFGHKLEGASLQEQLEFVQHELTQGSEKKAGERIKQTTSAAEAGAAVDKYYERSAGTERSKREANAQALAAAQYGQGAPAQVTVEGAKDQLAKVQTDVVKQTQDQIAQAQTQAVKQTGVDHQAQIQAARDKVTQLTDDHSQSVTATQTQSTAKFEADVKEMQANYNTPAVEQSPEDAAAAVAKATGYKEPAVTVGKSGLDAMDAAYKASLGPNYKEPDTTQTDKDFAALKSGATPEKTGLEGLAEASGYKEQPLAPGEQSKLDAMKTQSSVPVFTQDQLNKDLSAAAPPTVNVMKEGLGQVMPFPTPTASNLTAPTPTPTGISSPTPEAPTQVALADTGQDTVTVSLSKMNSLLSEMSGKISTLNTTAKSQVDASAKLNSAIKNVNP